MTPWKPVALVVRCVVPEPSREEFLGDLVEEWELVIRPQMGPRRAAWWLFRQVLGSALPMLQVRLKREVRMTPKSIKALLGCPLSSDAFDARLSAWLSQVAALTVTFLAIYALIKHPGTRADLIVGLSLVGVLALLLSSAGFVSWYLVTRLVPPPLKRRWAELAAYVLGLVLMIVGIKSMPTQGLRPAEITLWILAVCSSSIAILLGGMLTTVLRSPARPR